MNSLRNILLARANWICARWIEYAKKQGYAAYAAPSPAEWKKAVDGVCGELIRALDSDAGCQLHHAEQDSASDPFIQFALGAAQRHRERGVTLPLFLGLTKYMRRSFLEGVALDLSPQELPVSLDIITTFFDRLEVAVVGAWAPRLGADSDVELRERNRLLTSEKARYMMLFESLPNPVIITDSSGRITMMNHAGMIAFCGSAMPGEVLHEHHRLRAVTSALESELRRLTYNPSLRAHVDIALATATGNRSFRAQVSSLTSVATDERERLVVLIDITHQKDAEDALRASEERFRAFADNSPDAIVVLDDHGLIVYWNRAAQRTFGFAPEEIVGRSALDHLLASADLPSFEQQLQEFRQKGPSLENSPRRSHGLRRDGSPFPMEISLGAFPVRTGWWIVAVARDVTEQRLLEAKLVAAQKLEAIGQLAAGIAHEVNTPTQYVSDNVHFLRDAFRDLLPLVEHYREHNGAIAPAEAGAVDLEFLMGEIPSALEQSCAGLGRIATIVQAMKEMGHRDADEMTAADINHIVTNAVTVSRNEWKYVADVVYELDESLSPIPCHPGALSQVVLNLVVNAAHAIAPAVAATPGTRGTIRVRTAREGRNVVVRITDTGHGIPQAIRHRVFDPFFTTKGVGKGSGLGLSISRGVVVEQHHGTLDFEDAPGGGTCFIITLPLTVGEARSGALETSKDPR